jgi:transcriptional antiterminator NusG
MSSDQLIFKWYVLHTKSRFENVVNESLGKKSMEVFLPKVTVPSRRKDRKKLIRLPLFPGYVFVKSNLSPNHHLEILKTVGAVKLIGDQRGPISVPEDTVDSLRIMVAAEKPVLTGYQLQKGDRVMVVNGPFTGVIGIFDHFRGQGRIMVYIEALGQFAAVEVSLEDIEKIGPINS